MSNTSPRLLSGLAALLAASSIDAQTISEGFAASQEQLQRERDRMLRQQQERSPDVHVPPPNNESDADVSFAAQESPCFPIAKIRLIGEAAEVFQFALANVTGKDGALGRCLGTQGINTILARLQNTLILHG